MLTTAQRLPFTETLTSHISTSGVRPFTVAPTSLQWTSNHEHTRYFLVLSIAPPPANELNLLLHASNTAARSFALPPLYTTPVTINNQTQSQLRGGGRGRGRGLGRGRVLSGMRDQTREWKGGFASALGVSAPLTAAPDASSHFHVSIAWALEPPSSTMIEQLKEVDVGGFGLEVGVRAVKIKVGNVVEVLGLEGRVGVERGILGLCDR